MSCCTGCKKHECAELSWTDYNTVEDVHCNFKYKLEECKAHIGDTLRVYGWLFDSMQQKMLKSEKTIRGYQYLTNRKDIQFSNNMALLSTNPHVIVYIDLHDESLMPANPYDSILYIAGTIDYKDVPNLVFLRVNDVRKENEL